MLDASQPWLPLIDLGPVVAPPPRAARRAARKPVQALASQPTPDPTLDGVTPGEVRALRHAFLGLVARWDLSGPDTLTLMGEPLVSENERVERLRALAGVHRLLLLLHPERDRACAFLHGPCPALGGDTPLGAMLAGGLPAIARVCAHLAALANH